MNPTLYTQLLRLAEPETVVVVSALLVLFVDLAFLRAWTLRARFFTASLLASAGCIAAIARLKPI